LKNRVRTYILSSLLMKKRALIHNSKTLVHMIRISHIGISHYQKFMNIETPRIYIS